jgi:hypothetical protein
MRQFLANYEEPQPEKPKLKPLLLLALTASIIAFCTLIFSH